MSNYVAIFGTEEEYKEFDSHPKDHELKELADSIIRRLKITTPRNNPEKVKVGVYKLEIDKGQLNRRLVKTFEIMPYRERMTQEEYDGELESILKQVPEDFRQYVRDQSWEDGHSAGLEEVISIAQDIVDKIDPCIEKFKKRHKIKG